METRKHYNAFIEGLVIEEIIKDFGFNCPLTFTGKKWFGGSNLWTYYFVDDLGIKWEYDLSPRLYLEMAFRSPKFRYRTPDHKRQKTDK